MTKKTVTQRARKPKSVNAAQGLIDALKFVNATQKKNEHPFQKHVLIDNKMLVGNDGTLAIGAPVEEDITAAPRSDMLLAALNKCGEKFSLTVDNGQVCVSSGEFTAYIPCLPIEQMPVVFTSPLMMQIDDGLKAAFSAVMDLAKEGSPHVMTASLLLQPNSVIAANAAMIKEYWHGLQFPMSFILPKLAAHCVAKSSRTLAGVGGSTDSLTFWFSDKSFITSTLFTDGWTNGIADILNKPTNALPLPDNFWAGIASVVDFGESEFVCFYNGYIATESQQAIFEIDGLPAGSKYNGKLLKASKDYITRIDCQTHINKLYFFGDKIRGVLGGEPI